MSDTTMRTGAALLAELNDLIQLDHDAVEGYTLAIDSVRSDLHREMLVQFRSDHKQHIEELAKLVRDRGGVPIELPHLPTGPFKLAVQAAGAAAGLVTGDAAILLAFKTNEGQVRDRYRAAAARPLPSEVAAVVRRNAEDEETHYHWVVETLERIGHGSSTLTGQAERALETATGFVANAVEQAAKKVMEGAERLRGKG